MQILICNLGREFWKNGKKDNSASINLISFSRVLIPLILIFPTLPYPKGHF